MKNLFVFILIFIATPLFASAGGSMPWVGPMQKVMTSLTGPTAGIASAIGLCVSLITLVLSGGELTTLIKTLIFFVFVISLLVGTTALLSSLFGVNAAII